MISNLADFNGPLGLAVRKDCVTLSSHANVRRNLGGPRDCCYSVKPAPYGLSLLKTWSLEMSLNMTKAAKISSTTKAAW